MKKGVLGLFTALAVLLASLSAWGQGFGQHQNLKERALCVDALTGIFVIDIEDAHAPPGLEKTSLGKALVDRLQAHLERAGIPVNKEFSCGRSKADMSLHFLLLPISFSSGTLGYAIRGDLLIKDWTSHPYPVTIWDAGHLWVTPSRTAAGLRKDLEEMTDSMATKLALDWLKGNR
ncbi:hypothetical protein [Thermus tenuipuniceus]|uniref:hypothetical protein n=1 Tax=Thermus tenuipuniceus TaxID=2078690 RepID=UPI000FF8A95D|nr:hypothetical protein [Thermus tenuipuniceus]